MNLISEDYLMHHGVKGMKWGVRKSERWANSKHQPSSFRSSYLAGAYAATGSETVGKKLDKSNDRDAKKWEYYKQKNQKRIDKVAQKAKNKANRERDLANNIKKHGDWEDDEFFNLLTPSEKKAEWARSKKVAAQYFKTANYWDKAANSISKTKTKKEAKNLYKKYWHNAPEW